MRAHAVAAAVRHPRTPHMSLPMKPLPARPRLALCGVEAPAHKRQRWYWAAWRHRPCCGWHLGGSAGRPTHCWRGAWPLHAPRRRRPCMNRRWGAPLQLHWGNGNACTWHVFEPQAALRDHVAQRPAFKQLVHATLRGKPPAPEQPWVGGGGRVSYYTRAVSQLAASCGQRLVAIRCGV